MRDETWFEAASGIRVPVARFLKAEGRPQGALLSDMRAARELRKEAQRRRSRRADVNHAGTERTSEQNDHGWRGIMVSGSANPFRGRDHDSFLNQEATTTEMTAKGWRRDIFWTRGKVPREAGKSLSRALMDVASD